MIFCVSETGLCHALTGLNLLCDVNPWRCHGLVCIALSGQVCTLHPSSFTLLFSFKGRRLSAAFKCGGVNAAGTGRNAYRTLGLVSTPAGDGGLQGEVDFV